VPETRIIRWFALASLFVFVVIGVAITQFRAHDVRVREESAAAARAKLVANEAVGPMLTADDLSAPLTGARYDEFLAAVEPVMSSQPSVVRLKLWGTDGTVLFSTDPEQVGQRPGIEGPLEEALGGKVENEISDLTANENGSERLLADKLFETYVPFRFAESQPVAGVIEVYQDYSTIQAEIDRLTKTLSISLALGLLALYAVVLPLMVGVTRRLRRQNAQLHEQADQLSELLEREQATVAELRALDRMKSDFVAAASHELRTPLTSIRGYLHILRSSQASNDPQAAEAVAAIERQSARLSRLIANVLRESHLEPDDDGDPATTFAFDDLVRETSADLHDAGTRMANRVPEDLPPVTCDRRRVSEVLTNLLDNALKYSAASAPVTVGADVRDGTLRFWVEDEGIGIATGDLPRIFDRFYQVDQSATRAHGGVGLGLHIVHDLVEAMRGTIEVRSEPGVGSTFTVSVPPAGSATDDEAMVAGSSRG
jgi:signal transduction histidine kinase